MNRRSFGKPALSALASTVAALLLTPILFAQVDDTTPPVGMDAAKSGDYDKAIADSTQAIQANPQNAQAYFQRAFIYMETGEDDQALADLSQAIQIKPQFPTPTSGGLSSIW